jgi:site-specific DNA-methyltransferase (adenine-specific)
MTRVALNRTDRYEMRRADALEGLWSLEDASVDGVITDPPYSSGGMTRGDRSVPTAMKYVGNDVQLSRPDFAGDNRDQRSYLYWCGLWLGECLRIARRRARRSSSSPTGASSP